MSLFTFQENYTSISFKITCIDHFDRAKFGQAACPSLIICPATLCFHWSAEMKKFVKNRGDLVPFVYNGNMTQRLGLRKELLTEIRNIKGGLISEEIFQFGPNHPNHCFSTFHLKNNEEQCFPKFF